jgi:hypothetical protein
MTRRIIAIMLILVGSWEILGFIVGAVNQATMSDDRFRKTQHDMLAKAGNINPLVEDDLVKEWTHQRQQAKYYLAITFVLGMSFLSGGLVLIRGTNKAFRLSSTSRIRPLIKKQNQTLAGVLVLFILAFVISGTFFGATNSPPWFLVLFLSASGIFHVGRRQIYFNRNFLDTSRHLINWEYPNGDLLVITPWGLMKFNETTPKATTSVKFEGVKWEFDNVKDLAECVVKGEGNPILALLPSIEFSTTSNQVEDYIPFGFFDKVDLIFSDLKGGVLLVQIEKKSAATRYRLLYPKPDEQVSIDSDVNLFERRIEGKVTPVRGVYLKASSETV